MKKLFTMITAATLMAACAEDITTNRTDGDKRYISFSVSNEQNTSTRSIVAPWAEEQTEMADVEEMTVEVETDLPTEYPLSLTITDEPYIRRADADVTRGALLNSGDAASLQFGVTEFLTSDPTTPLFSNSKPAYERTLDDGRELFKANEFWEYDAYDGINYDFYAYAPKVDGTAQGITIHTSDATEEEIAHRYRRITYDAAGVAVNNQPDLMTARKWSSSYVGAIPLNFQHRLCAIQIVTAGTWATGYHVSGVQFTNVISSGTFDIDTDKGEDWFNYGSPGVYTVTGFNPAAATGTTITGTVTPTTDEKWLMLPPQTLDGAKLSITMSDNATPTPNSYTISAPIHASTWRAGHTVTYTVSPEAVSDLTVNYPTGSARSWKDGSNPVTGPVTTYTTTDQFGLFVLDKDNNIFISNQCVSPTAGSDAASRTLNIPSLFKSKQFRYFLMYPYISDADLETLVTTEVYTNYYKLNGTGRPASADAFFAEVIANWAPASDQSNPTVFKKQDLQIAKLSGDNFDMVHKMGLVEIELKTNTYYDVVESNGGTSTITKTATNKNSTASSSFDNSGSYHVPMQSGSTNLYYAIVSTDDASTQFNSTSGTNQWTAAYTATGLSSGGFAHYDAYSIRGGTSIYSGSFSYCGTYLPFTVPFDGTYTIECWGASGGNGNSDINSYGRGAYVKGDISLSKDDVFYIYIGQQGATTSSTAWNGGGPKGTESKDGSGGGATDVRTKVGLNSTQLSSWGTAWNDDYGLRGRIMVAGGGGGSDDTSGAEGAYGVSGYTNSNVYIAACAGGLYSPSPSHITPSIGGYNYGATQTSYGYASRYNAYGGFGRGNSSSITQCAGGGSGYWGGGASDLVGMGGSCYISGHPGCIAIASAAGTSASTAGSDNSVERATHYSGLKFTNTIMIDGAGYPWTTSKGASTTTMPTPPGGTISAGNVGHGYCRITGTSVAP